MSWAGMNTTIGWLLMRGRAHKVEVRWTSSNHGQPFRAYCTCGWISNMYPSRDAAQRIGNEHVQHSIRDAETPARL